MSTTQTKRSSAVREEWLALHREEIIDPERVIVDAHHHLGDKPGRMVYLFPELLADMKTGHNVRATVYMEWRSMYRRGGLAEMRPVGEVEFINGIAAQAASGLYGPHYACAAIVGSADLRLGDRVKPVLEALCAASSRFRGIRHGVKWHASNEIHSSAFTSPSGLMLDPTFQQGARCLGRAGLSLDIWAYHTQLGELAALIRSAPETTVVVNHFGGPLGVGPYKGRRDEVFREWKAALGEIASCPNAMIKTGGLGLPASGIVFHDRKQPPSSVDLEEAWRPYFETAVNLFGAERCMFESNFPIDKRNFSYPVVWNAFKRLAQGASEAEKTALFSGTAMKTYRLAAADLE